ncbi:MAG TPA: hypothetical protein VIG99_16950 [Myxococcaceae bacterium]|jgi:hypothetical protein
MMIASPQAPRTLRGAIVGVDLFNPAASTVVFQYNPDSITRTLQPRQVSEDGNRAEALRLTGAPVETLKLDVEIDAADQGGLVAVTGIYPQLSSLEMLIYPKTAQVIVNSVLLAVGTIEVVPPAGPLTLLVWGLRRVVPVRITELSITEEAYDARLNPVRAKVSLGLRVLSYSDLSITHPGYGLFLAHQAVKETMATLGRSNPLSGMLSG